MSNSADKIKNSDLFDCIPDMLLPLFEGKQYPWEILPDIKGFVGELSAKGIEGFTELEKGIWIGEDVKISPLATILPPAIICDGTEIRTGAFLRGNVFVGKKCVVGNASELKNSVLMDGANVPHYNYVGDSILGNGAHMGAGSIASNLKSDKTNITVRGNAEYKTGLRKMGAVLGDFAEIGCGSVLNPGTVVGKRSNVYPLTSVRGVVPPNCIVKSSDNIVEKEER